MKLLTMHSSPLSCYLVSLSPDYISQLPNLEQSQAIYFLQTERPDFRSK
jgi:hypothetical protein